MRNFTENSGYVSLLYQIAVPLIVGVGLLYGIHRFNASKEFITNVPKENQKKIESFLQNNSSYKSLYGTQSNVETSQLAKEATTNDSLANECVDALLED